MKCSACNSASKTERSSLCVACRKARAKEQMRARYDRCKTERLCVDCTDPLTEEDGAKTKCLLCRQRSSYSTRIYTERNRASYNVRKAENRRRKYYSQHAENLSKLRETRLRKKLDGVCYDCAAPCLPDNARCERHRELDRRYGRKYWAKQSKNYAPRKAPAPLPPKPPRRPPVDPVIGIRDAVREYRPQDERTTRERLLIGMRFLDWSSLDEVMQASGVLGTWRDSDYDALLHVLRSMVRAGVAERTGSPKASRYRLSCVGIKMANEVRMGARMEAA